MDSDVQKKRKKLLLIAAILCVLLLLIIGGWFFLAKQGPGDTLELADNATIGILPGVDIAQRQAELQQQLDEGMIAFSINTNPVFATGGSEGNLMLENPANNAKLLVVEIYIDDTQELIYQSKAIPVGSYIETAGLDKVLEPGQYAATAYFKAYREDDYSYIGQAGAAISITVLS
ncbi:MAG: hypothetical protein HDT14_01375 [Oscillibacter sp.]|nr:hypothetical protein [Oscillibacter sp.]